jgi:histidine triad (HIT) family protein
MDCLFCKIIDKTIPADIVYEDDRVIAFRDVAPQAPTHILVIPRQHISTLNDLNESNNELIGHILYVAKTIAADEGLAEDGYRVAMNCNNHGGQTVFHIHLHLLGGRQMQWPPG